MASEHDHTNSTHPDGEPTASSSASAEGNDAWSSAEPADELDVHSRQEEMAVVRERAKLMRWLGFGDDEAIALFQRMRLAGLSGDRAFLGATAADRIVRLRAELDAKIRRIPRFAFPEFRSRYRLGQRVTANSDLMKNIGDDADEIARMLILSSEMIVRLTKKLDEQIALHETLSARMDATRSLEDNAVQRIPAWLADVARMVESTGFDRARFRKKGATIAEGIRQLLELHADPDLAAPTVADRMVERVAKYIEEGFSPDDRTAAASNRLDFDGDFEVDDANSSPLHAEDVHGGSITGTRPGELGAQHGDDTQDRIAADDREDGDDAMSAEPEAQPFFPPHYKATSSSDRPSEEARPTGFQRIDGVSIQQAFAGLFSQFEKGSMSAELAGIPSRMDERAPVLPSSIALIDGALPDDAWLHYEVPNGDYVMVQMTGESAVLPSFRVGAKGSGMLPPFLSMRKYGELAGVSDDELRTLALWDREGSGPEHLRASVAYGQQGDTAQAYHVMKRAVRAHLGGVIGSDAAARMDARVIDNLARFWLFLVVGRKHTKILDELWPGGLFHGVQGHDPGLGNGGYMLLLRFFDGPIPRGMPIELNA